jgi:pyruvate dehydrogenase E2 component (dihydrolipoamide acetyltransferase)
MVTEVIMPKMGQTMEKGKIVRWLKKEGEAVQKDEPLLEIETDKTMIEVESRGVGILKKILVHEDEEAPVAAVIGYIAKEGEPLPEVPSQQTEPTFVPSSVGAVIEQPKPVVSVEEAERVKASPLAKKLADELGVNINQVRGTGPGGRITREDIVAFSQKKPSQVTEGATPAFQTVPMTSMRKAIAAQMAKSKASVPHFYVSIKVDMTEASALREKMLPTIEAESGVRLSYTHMLVKAVAMALKEFPLLNSTFDGESIKQWKDVNVGVAVSLDDGLIVPVLRKADGLSLKETAVRTAELAAKARDKRLREEEFSGGAFTVSSMGAFGVDSFVAIINVPEVAILASGSVRDEAAVVNGTVVARKAMDVTLSADHRVVDGVYAAKFLQKIKSLLEMPQNLV